MKTRILLAFMVAALALPVAAGLFSAKGDNAEEKRAAVRKDRDEILAKLYAEKPEAKEKIQKAAGYGTFNNKSMNLFLLSTGHGYGMVMDKGGKETFMAMGSLGGGVGLGAQGPQCGLYLQERRRDEEIHRERLAIRRGG